MKRKVGICIIIILNIATLVAIGGLITVTYGIIVGCVGKIHAEAFTEKITNEILIKLSYLVTFAAALNYWILNKVVCDKHPFRTTIILLILCVIITTPFLLSRKKKFFIQHSESDNLNHYYDRFAVSNAIIISAGDTVEIKKLNDFTAKIYAKHISPIKYDKTMKLIFLNNDGTNDTIPTNGQIFGPFKGNYFKADRNIIYDYLTRCN